MTGTAIISIHDVRPSTLDDVSSVVQLLRSRGIDGVSLLVVPGADWDRASLGVLKSLVDEGCGLAGHGWEHRAPPPATLGHRLHAAFLSRDQAEHLSRSTEDLLGRVRQCHEWFGSVGLPVPELYVPPAWALGRVSKPELAELPFRWYEVLTGYLDADTGTLRIVPLLGFEADNLARRVALYVTNQLNLTAGRLSGRPIRIAIHPSDFRRGLAGSLEAILRREWRFDTMESVLGGDGRLAGGQETVDRGPRRVHGV